MLRIVIDGIFSVEDLSGNDLTPKGAKTRGLLALLVTANGYERSRAFLQDKLWSTRGQDQGSASLRQALTELRKSLGVDSDIVTTRQGVIKLDASRIQMIRKKGPGTIPFEDLSIRDPEFENWLRDIRMQLDAEPLEPSVTAAPLQTRSVRNSANPVLVFAEIQSKFLHYIQPFQDQLARSIWEIEDVDIFDLSKDGQLPPEGQGRALFSVDCRVSEAFGILNFHVTIKEADGRQLWRSEVARADVENRDQTARAIEGLSRQTCHALLDLWRPDSGLITKTLPLAVFSQSYRQAFSFSRRSLSSADRLTQLAYSQNMNPTFLAWQAFLRNTAMFEHLTTDFLEERDNDALITTALTEAPENSFVLALAAQHSLVNTQDVDYGKFLCERAIDRNASNTLAWAFMSNIHSMRKDYKDALQAAEIAVNLSKGHPLQSFVTIFRCMALIGLNELEPAILDAQFASAINPDYQAIRRYLLASSLVVGRKDIAKKTLAEIRAREPDFRQAEFMNENYPVGTLRSMPIVDRLASAV
ncbi:MAG: hypothetical protein AAFR73_01240 [Pseudomonadota bacterium]